MAKDKKGFFDKILSELNEPDAAEVARQKALDTPVKPKPTAPSSVPLTSVPTAAPIGGYTPAPLNIQAAVELDPETVNTINLNVYVANVNGHKSEYVTFLQMWEALGQPPEPYSAIKALNVTDKSITIQGIRADYQAHIDLLDQYGAQTSADLDAAAKEKVGILTTAADELRAANDAAAQEIARHVAETEARNTQIAELAAKEAETNTKISRAHQVALVAQNDVRGKLVAMSTILNKE